MKPPLPTRRSYRLAAGRLAGMALASVMAFALAPARLALAADPSDEHAGQAPSAPAKKRIAPIKDIAAQLREAVAGGTSGKKPLALVINSDEKKSAAAPATIPAETHAVATSPQASRQALRARAAALAGHEPANAHAGADVHWSYAGDSGPQAWAKLKPEFNGCATGQRQSPIHIEESFTLQGPAEPLLFNYQASSGTVVNNGHTIQVDLAGDNTLTVRGSSYKLLQFHFHHPAEEKVNATTFAMVAHLVHKNEEGQLAVVAVLLDPGVANSLVNKVWTYMPLDSGDRVRMPAGLIDMNELLPKDQRYYRFMGSLTTPPCTEGVLWMVLKQAMPISREQLKLFAQLFPNNARPVQPLHARVVRDAQ